MNCKQLKASKEYGLAALVYIHIYLTLTSHIYIWILCVFFNQRGSAVEGYNGF